MGKRLEPVESWTISSMVRRPDTAGRHHIRERLFDRQANVPSEPIVRTTMVITASLPARRAGRIAVASARPGPVVHVAYHPDDGERGPLGPPSLIARPTGSSFGQKSCAIFSLITMTPGRSPYPDA